MEYRCTACGSKEPCRFINGKKNRILGRPTKCAYGEYDKVKWVILYENKDLTLTKNGDNIN